MSPARAFELVPNSALNVGSPGAHVHLHHIVCLFFIKVFDRRAAPFMFLWAGQGTFGQHQWLIHIELGHYLPQEIGFAQDDIAFSAPWQIERKFNVILEIQRIPVKADNVEIRSAAITQDTFQEFRRLAVLPFSCAPDDEILADGIVSEIITNLSRIKKLRIIANSTSKHYRKHSLSIQEVGQALNVHFALEGNLRRSGDRVRVLAQLVNTRDGFQMWNSRFEGKARDIFDMEDEISGAIVAELNRHFVSMESLELGFASPAIDSEASELYFKGLSFQSTLRIDDMKQAIGFFIRVIELAPDFATAHAKLAISCSNLHRLMLPSAPTGLLAQAEVEAQKAITLEPSNPEAHVALALVAKNRGDFASTMRHLREALKLSPNHTTALSWLSYVLIHTGRCDEGEKLARKAIERDPAGSIHYNFLGYALISQGRFMEAANVFDRALRIDPRSQYAYAVLLLCNLYLNRMEEAKIMRDFLVHLPNLPLQVLTVLAIYEQVTSSPEKVPLSEELAARIAYEPEAERLAADIFALRGDTQCALRYLESSVSKGLLNLGFIERDPFLRPLYASTGFLRLKQYLKDSLNRFSAIS